MVLAIKVIFAKAFAFTMKKVAVAQPNSPFGDSKDLSWAAIKKKL